MKLHILSDLHLEVNTFNIPKTDADVIILAGDIHEGSAAVKWIQEQTDTPVVYITGNHEYYGHFCPELKYELRRICPSNRNIIYDGPEIHFLENQSVVINGVRFLGCTLWTENTHEHRDRNIGNRQDPSGAEKDCTEGIYVK